MQKILHLAALVVLGMLATTMAQAAPKVAVTDLTYEERVQEYFHVVSAHAKSSARGSYSDHERETPNTYSNSSRGSFSGKSESSYYEAEGTYSYIDRGELRKFTADIKGSLLRSGQFSVIQGKPYGTKDLEKIYDIIARIKRGDFKGADYVLFGSVSSIQFREETQPIPGANSLSQILALELVVDFSLIDTRTHEIKAAFSAMGEGQDTRLISSRGAIVTMNRGKVISEVSKSLAEDVLRQIEEQTNGGYRPENNLDSHPITPRSASEEVIIYR